MGICSSTHSRVPKLPRKIRRGSIIEPSIILDLNCFTPNKKRRESAETSDSSPLFNSSTLSEDLGEDYQCQKTPDDFKGSADKIRSLSIDSIKEEDLFLKRTESSPQKDTKAGISGYEHRISLEAGSLRIIFDCLDIDGDGVIRAADIAEALSQVMGLPPAGKHELAALESIVWQQQDGQAALGWSFTQFKGFMLSQTCCDY